MLRRSKRLLYSCVLVCIFLYAMNYFKNTTDIEQYTEFHRYISRKEDVGIQSEDSEIQSNETSCETPALRLSEVPLPITGIVSYQGAGNTWVRYLLQKVSGLATASVYCDKLLRNTSFPFECHREYDKVLGVKSHRWKNWDLSRFERAILIIRNPYDNLLTYFHYRFGGKHTGYTKNRNFLNGVWDAHVYYQIPIWMDYHLKWLNQFKGPLYPLLNDNLKHDLYNELQRVFDFLEVKISKIALSCTVKNSEGLFHRQKVPIIGREGQILTKKDLYTKDMIGNITVAVNEVRHVLKTKYGIDWNVSPPVD